MLRLLILAIVDVARPEQTTIVRCSALSGRDVLTLHAFARAWGRQGHGRTLLAFERGGLQS